jgi:acetyltransferase-like isoleucine patch superfamily enzyme
MNYDPKLSINAETGILGTVIVESPFKNCGGIIQDATLGAFSYLSHDVELFNVDIGRYCSIADHTTILLSHPTGAFSSSPFFYNRYFEEPFVSKNLMVHNTVLKTTIGNDVWIGSGVKIKTGITIGDGAIVGAGSVITKDVAPYSIVGGIPAKLIRMRFCEEIIERLQTLAWWQYNLLDLSLQWDDVEATLLVLEKLKLNGELKLYSGTRFQVWNDDKGGISGKLIKNV